MKDWKRVVLLSLAAFLYRAGHYFLFSDKIVAGSDPMQNILMARRFAAGDYYGVLDTYWTPIYAILVGTVTFFVDDIILPAVIVSIVFGSLAAPLTYYLVRQSYGPREAMLAGVIAVFYPYLLNSVFAIGTETIYLVWVIGGLIVGWKALRESSPAYHFATGFLLGLAYLTRPEAIGYPLFFVAITAIKNFRQRKMFTRAPVLQVGALILGFAILAAPYIFYLRSSLGTWTVSGKTEVNFAVGALGNGETAGGSAAQEPGTEKIKRVLVTIAANLRQAQTSIANLLFPFLIVLIALGLFCGKWSEERLKREAYLISFCLLTILGYGLTVALERYFYVLLPVFFGWVALGILHFERWFRMVARIAIPNKLQYLPRSRSFVVIVLAVIFVYVFHVNFYVRSTVSAWQSLAFEERDAGLWLKKTGRQSPVIFSASFRPVFYAEGKQYWVENEDLSQIVAKIKSSRVDYVVDSERMHDKEPVLKRLDEVLRNDPEFELIYQKIDQPGHKISIFRLK